MNTLRAKLGDFVLFQIGWFACVLTGARGQGWIGAVAAALVIALHVAFIARTPKDRSIELRNVLIFGTIGCIADGTLTQLGLLRFHESEIAILGLPLWMAALWFLFPMLFNSSLGWMRGMTAVAALFGLIGGPLAYYSGVRLEALAFGDEPLISAAAVGIVWALFTPLALRFSRRTDEALDPNTSGREATDS